MAADEGRHVRRVIVGARGRVNGFGKSAPCILAVVREATERAFMLSSLLLR